MEDINSLQRIKRVEGIHQDHEKIFKKTSKGLKKAHLVKIEKKFGLTSAAELNQEVENAGMTFRKTILRLNQKIDDDTKVDAQKIPGLNSKLSIITLKTKDRVYSKNAKSLGAN